MVLEQEMKLQRYAYVVVLRVINMEKLNVPFDEDHPSDIEKMKRDDMPEAIWKYMKNSWQPSRRIYPRVYLPNIWCMNSK